MSLELVAFDIETTGFAVDDEITVAGFALPLGVRVVVQTPTSADSAPAADTVPPEQVPARVNQVVETHVAESLHVDVQVCESEAAVLEALGAFADQRLVDRELLLVGFNAERWRGGFDLPFLRTRLAQCNTAWPFPDLPYADILPLIDHRFNTQRATGDAPADLVSTYDTLCDGTYSQLDPFDESSAAVDAFADGRLAELVLHNVADVLRTRALARLAERYCSKSDFQLKSLTPTAQDD